MAATGGPAEPSMGPLITSATTVALYGDMPTMRGGAIMIAIAASAMASVFGIMTLIAVIIAGSTALSGMVSRTMMIMATTLVDAVGCTAGPLLPAALIGGTAIMPASTITTDKEGTCFLASRRGTRG